jgi:hypothetical protein
MVMERVMAYSMAISHNLIGDTEENHKTPRIDGNSSEIQIGYLQDTNL